MNKGVNLNRWYFSHISGDIDPHKELKVINLDGHDIGNTTVNVNPPESSIKYDYKADTDISSFMNTLGTYKLAVITTNKKYPEFREEYEIVITEPSTLLPELDMLEKLTVAQLKELLGEQGISYPSNAKKAELIELIKSS